MFMTIIGTMMAGFAAAKTLGPTIAVVTGTTKATTTATCSLIGAGIGIVAGFGEALIDGLD
jgi:hypothetical protein